MKTITKYITEKLKIGKTYKQEYTCQPKDKFELREILEERLAKDKNADLNDIDVSKITDMGVFDSRGLFEGLDPHNIDVSRWNVSNVESMDGVFLYCENLDCDLSNWDVSNVKDMRRMFGRCKKFNCYLNDWNVKNVENTSYMFYNCNNFNSDLSDWDMSNVEDTCCMFYNCTKFEGEGLEKWKMKNVSGPQMYEMFNECTSLKNMPKWYFYK